MTENEMHFNIIATLIGTKHNGVGSFIIELEGMKAKLKIYAIIIVIKQRTEQHMHIRSSVCFMGVLPTFVRSSVALPADSNFIYEPPHS